MTRALAILFLIGSLSGCSATDIGKAALGAAVGGGPSVNANAQVGKTNSQTVGSSRVIEMAGPVARPENVGQLNQNTTQDASESQVKADRVETVVVNQIPMWLLAGMAGVVVLFGVVGWLSPQPRWVRR
ncbi:hypothetical protein [Sulfitobacter dubius]|uniref:hypothetical protein n=1 Tax=Sulfitobacter dubius TaxID=218673 RepID=UPI0022AF369D|nr:hypothetical protein [Sulfitobacter dubius]MCZ4366610.1 hypothetical protein [Sulfitobacter dubius]